MAIIGALKAALAAATTKEEKFDINQMIKELKLQLKSDRQPGIEKANKSKTSKKPRNFPMTPKLTMLQDDPQFKAKGGEVKKYMGGGSVHKNKNKMLTTKGWGASRKT